MDSYTCPLMPPLIPIYWWIQGHTHFPILILKPRPHKVACRSIWNQWHTYSDIYWLPSMYSKTRPLSESLPYLLRWHTHSGPQFPYMDSKSPTFPSMNMKSSPLRYVPISLYSTVRERLYCLHLSVLLIFLNKEPRNLTDMNLMWGSSQFSEENVGAERPLTVSISTVKVCNHATFPTTLSSK